MKDILIAGLFGAIGGFIGQIFGFAILLIIIITIVVPSVNILHGLALAACVGVVAQLMRCHDH
jgi:hypothetical protein